MPIVIPNYAQDPGGYGRGLQAGAGFERGMARRQQHEEELQRVAVALKLKEADLQMQAEELQQRRNRQAQDQTVDLMKHWENVRADSAKARSERRTDIETGRHNRAMEGNRAAAIKASESRSTAATTADADEDQSALTHIHAALSQLAGDDPESVPFGEQTLRAASQIKGGKAKLKFFDDAVKMHADARKAQLSEQIGTQLANNLETLGGPEAIGLDDKTPDPKTGKTSYQGLLELIQLDPEAGEKQVDRLYQAKAKVAAEQQNRQANAQALGAQFLTSVEPGGNDRKQQVIQQYLLDGKMEKAVLALDDHAQEEKDFKTASILFNAQESERQSTTTTGQDAEGAQVSNTRSTSKRPRSFDEILSEVKARRGGGQQQTQQEPPASPLDAAKEMIRNGVSDEIVQKFLKAHGLE